MSTRGIQFKFYAGEIVLCFEPDPTKARVIYEAKILDTTVYRDEEGKKQPGYHIHFLRWNNSWDRVVSEWFVLKDTDSNRVLMRQLADVARKVRKNRSRRKKIGEILSRAFDGKPPAFESGSEDSDNDITTDTNGTEDEASATESVTDSMDSLPKSEDKDNKLVPRTHNVELNIPESLKTVLDKDYFAINHDVKLVRLPAEINVVTVLESFVKMFTLDFWNTSFDRTHFCHTPPKISIDRVLPMCKEFVDGLRICFDFALPLVLLYGAEKSQYEKITASYKHKSPAKSKLPLTEESPLIQSPRIRSAGRFVSTVDEPSPKLPKLTPNLSDSDNDSEVTFRNGYATTQRMTRRSLHKSKKLEKTDTQLSVSSLDTRENRSDKKPPSAETPISSRTRRSTDKPIESATPRRRKMRKQRKSSDTSNDSDKSKPEPQAEEPKSSSSHKADKDKPDLPPPLLIPCDISATQENEADKAGGGEGGGAVEKGAGGSSDSLGESGREEILDGILAWQLLPDSIQRQLPTPPTLLYGAHHLLRLFVKLPDLLSRMEIEDDKLGVLLKLLQQLLLYLSEHIRELFPESSYMSA